MTRCRWPSHSRVSRVPGRNSVLGRLKSATRRSIRRYLELGSLNLLMADLRERPFVEAGGLLSYGADISHMYRRSAVFVSKILQGTKPADLPIEQPTKFELVINLKTAKAIGIDVPLFLQQRADEVIE